jgi:hypothetical protein
MNDIQKGKGIVNTSTQNMAAYKTNQVICEF